jgi:hypothetical protein
MFRNGRPEDQVFAPEELLFRRYLKEHFESGRISDAHFSFPPSLNREKYSEPKDVLFSDEGSSEGCGVLEFRVDEVLAEIQNGVGAVFAFFPHHVPLDTNYSHTEIRCENAEAPGTHVLPNSVVKKKYRAILSQRSPRVRIPATR